MYNKFEQQKPFALLDTSKYPPEVAGRFNSFITTQFDDSLSVEMQMRSIIKWAIDNFKEMDQTYNDFTEYIIQGNLNPFIEFLNDLIEYMNNFIDTFDSKLTQNVIIKLNEWLDDGTLADIINNDVFDMKADKTFVDSEIERLDQKDENLTTQLAQTALNVKSFGAKGDGVTDDTLSIQNALDLAYSNGGGVVYVPNGKYITSKALRVRDNVTLKGVGHASWIHNNKTLGFERCVVITGNIGDITSQTSVYDNPQHAVMDVEKGHSAITLENTSSIYNFSVGDVVFLLSQEKWSDTFPDSVVPKYQDMNKIVSINGTTIQLERAVKDKYVNPTICKVGTVLGYDQEPSWIAENATVKDLRLTHNMGEASGWYAVFAYGYKCTFTNLTLDQTSTPFGSNALGYSTVSDIVGNFDAGALDFADMQIGNTYRNIKLTRVGVNSGLNVIGVSCHDGADNTFTECMFDFGGYGGFAGLYNHRLTITHSTIINADSTSLLSALYGCLGDGFYCDHVTIEKSKKHGIYVPGSRSHVLHSTVMNMDYKDTGYGITLSSNVTESTFIGNIVGGTNKTQRDTIFQNSSFQTSNCFDGNNTYNTQLNVNNNAFIATSNIEPTTLKSYTIKNNLGGKNKAITISASGTRSGTSGDKKVSLKIGNVVVSEVEYAPTDSDRWFLECTIIMSDYQQGGRVIHKAMKNLSLISQSVQMVTDGMNQDSNVSILGSVENPSDSINCDVFVVSVE